MICMASTRLKYHKSEECLWKTNSFTCSWLPSYSYLCYSNEIHFITKFVFSILTTVFKVERDIRLP